MTISTYILTKTIYFCNRIYSFSFQVSTINQKLKIAFGPPFHRSEIWRCERSSGGSDIIDAMCGSILIAPVAVDRNANGTRRLLRYRLPWWDVGGSALTCLRTCGRLIAARIESRPREPCRRVSPRVETGERQTRSRASSETLANVLSSFSSSKPFCQSHDREGEWRDESRTRRECECVVRERRVILERISFFFSRKNRIFEEAQDGGSIRGEHQGVGLGILLQQQPVATQVSAIRSFSIFVHQNSICYFLAGRS